MPFKNPQTGYYYSEIKLPGYGKLRRRSLGTKKKGDAIALENAIRATHRAAIHDPRLSVILDELQGQGHGKSGSIDPQDLLLAVRAPDGSAAGLERLLRRLDDPPLSRLAECYLAEGGDVTRAEEIGLPVVVRYAEKAHGAGCGISVLREAENVEALLRAVEVGEENQPNTVIRFQKRAISKLLNWRYGKVERDRVMGEVKYEATDDRRRLRDSIVTPIAIDRLCRELEKGYYKEGDEAAPLYVRIAVMTGAEVGPLSKSLNRDWTGQTLHLRGTKRVKDGRGRDRELRLPSHLTEQISRYHDPEAPDQRLFPLDKSRFDTMWKKAVKRAKLTQAVFNGAGEPTPLRPHDLRQVFAAVAERAGVPRTAISVAGLGHNSLDMTDRYLLRETSITWEHLERMADELGWAPLAN